MVVQVLRQRSILPLLADARTWQLPQAVKFDRGVGRSSQVGGGTTCGEWSFSGFARHRLEGKFLGKNRRGDPQLGRVEVEP